MGRPAGLTGNGVPPGAAAVVLGATGIPAVAMVAMTAAGCLKTPSAGQLPLAGLSAEPTADMSSILVLLVIARAHGDAAAADASVRQAAGGAG